MPPAEPDAGRPEPSAPEAGAGGPELSAEDAKLVTLARATLHRTAAPTAAAVRDGSGRTYTAAAVELPKLRLTALAAALVVAAASGTGRLEAAALVSGPAGDGPADEHREGLAADDLERLAAVGVRVVHLAGPEGVVRETRRW